MITAKATSKAKAKARALALGTSSETKAADKKLSLDNFVKSRDYTGATVLLEFQKSKPDASPLTLPWLGYAYFHNQQYQKALEVYQQLLKADSPDPVHHLHAACCLFYLGEYEDAEAEALKGPATRLQNRLLFHVSHKMKSEEKLMKYHAKITDSAEDQLSLASIHYLRNHYQEATDVYKRLLLEHREWLALQVYVAMCYYKLDYYDVSLEILQPYLNAQKDSAIAINLKACNHYKLYDGKAAEAELKPVLDLLQSSSLHVDNPLIRHNLVVFRNGENALQVLPPLVDTIPEARLNLVIFHLRHNEIDEAEKLVKDLEPITPQDYIIKGVVNAAIGQDRDSREHLKMAQTYFQTVGASPSECDTIPGRQCMASCFFLLKQFEDVLIYLNSVKAYSVNDPVFNYNHGVALAAYEQYKEAEEALLSVTDERIRNEYCYLSWLARCFIMNGKPRDAWELYLKMEATSDSFALLVLIANECYKVGSFLYAAKAFDVLERLDPTPEHWEGKRGACCGVFQQCVARKEKREHLRDVINMLRMSSTPQAELMVRVMVKWAAENGMSI